MTGILNLLAGALGRIPSDPYFEYTTLLLPGNGTNGAQNNTFLDGSTNNFTVTRNGNTTQGTFSPFSQTGWGNYFDGSGDFLSAPSNAAFTLGTGDLTVECWVYQTAAAGSDNCIAGIGSNTTNTPHFFLGFPSFTGRLVLNSYSGDSVYGDTTVSLNQWNHIVFTRQSGIGRIFLNGVLDGYGTYDDNLVGSDLVIGRGYSNLNQSYFAGGYISNFRLIKGSVPSLYQTSSSTKGTTIFTPPTTALTDVSGTSILTCQSNRFIDNSTANSGSGFTITVNGNTSVVAFSPFNPTASWSAATYGGSGYFDGSGDYLSAANNTAFDFGTGDFTVECWLYYVSVSTDHAIISRYATTIGWALRYTTTTGFQFGNGDTNLVNKVGVPTNGQWYHLAVSRQGTNLRLFINGDLSATATDSTSLSSSTTLYVNRLSSTVSWEKNCYISNVRIVKGTAVYTAAFTPPTAPLSAITNTSLLLNFTNAGIYDATSKNDLETVGNAQISTTQSKWGGSSISFDGTGDWLLIPDQPPQRIGTGKFTIELWVYRNSSGTYGLVGKGTSTTGWLVSLNSSNQVVFTYASSTITSTGTVSATTWTHIAVVREGTSTNQTKIYINGTNDGTGTVSTDFNQTNSMYVGADRTGGSAANAYVQDVRITNYARYTANFTAPTAAFPTL